MGLCKTFLSYSWGSAWTLIGVEPARDADETQPMEADAVIFNLSMPVSDEEGDIPASQPGEPNDDDDDGDESEKDEKPREVQSRGWHVVNISKQKLLRTKQWSGNLSQSVTSMLSLCLGIKQMKIDSCMYLYLNLSETCPQHGSQALQPAQVLTRRDQLKMKEERQKSKKEEQDRKKQEKAAKALAKKVEAEEKKKAKQEQKEAAKAAIKSGKTTEPTRKTRKRKAAAPEEVEEECPEGEKGEAEVEECEKKPRKKRKTQKKVEVEEGHGSEDQVEEPKPKRKAAKSRASKPSEPKAKVKVEKTDKAAAAAAKQEPHDGDDLDDAEPATPKKKINKCLFQSEDEGDQGDDQWYDEMQEKKKMGIEKKTGDVKPLQEIFDNDIPKRLVASRAKKAEKAQAAEHAGPSGRSLVEPAETEKPKRKRTAKGKSKAKAGKKEDKQELSPFTKKQIRARKKKETESMQASPEEDKQVQGVILQHMKNCREMTLEALKEYLYGKVTKKFPKSYLNPYITRGSCGVKVKLPGWKAPHEIFYFGKSGTALTFNDAAVISYVSASLMVS